MGNGPSAPDLEVGYVINFTPEEVVLHTENCRPDHNRVKNDENCFMGLDLFSDTGFISDADDLMEVAKLDDETVMRLIGPSGHEKIAKLLMLMMFLKEPEIRTKHPALFPDWEINMTDFEVTSIDWCGNQRCPFVKSVTVKYNEGTAPREKQCWSMCDKQSPACGTGTDYNVTKKSTGETLNFSGLMPHMIWHHHFYEGNVPHRVDPEAVIRFFNIV